MYRATNKKKDIELHSGLFELMLLYGTKENYAVELIDLHKLYGIDYGHTPDKILDILRETAQCGESTISFIFADTFLTLIKKERIYVELF
jgi:hypothetical protein